MTPKEKAIEFYKDFYYRIPTVNDLGEAQHESAKQCALIAVEEIIKNLIELSNGDFTFIHNVEYWQEVKQKIENL